MTKTYRSVLRQYKATPERVQNYFPNFEDLVTKYDWEVSVSYALSRVEQAKRMTIYCGIVKKHWCDSGHTWKKVSTDHLGRARFKELFKKVFGKKIPDALMAKLEKGEAVRDKIAHGMTWEPKEAREGLIGVLEFASEFNDLVYAEAGFRPFGDLRGYKGRKETLTVSTTDWVLRGMGIPEKNNS